MAIEGKNFILNKNDIGLLTNKVPIDIYRQMLITYDSNPFQIQCFKKTSTTSVDGIIIYFSGGDGNFIQNNTLEGPSYVENNNFLFINFTAMQALNSFYTVNRSTYSFSDMHYYEALEVDLVLNYLFNNIISDVLFNGTFNLNTPVYLCGHSRGAGVLCKWSAMQHLVDTSIYTKNVKCIGANSPGGSNDGGGAYNAQYALQASYNLISKIKIPTLITLGAKDYTHITRSEAERFFRDISTNKKFKIKIVNSGTGEHWPYLSYSEFFNDTIAFGNQI